MVYTFIGILFSCSSYTFIGKSQRHDCTKFMPEIPPGFILSIKFASGSLSDQCCHVSFSIFDFVNCASGLLFDEFCALWFRSLSQRYTRPLTQFNDYIWFYLKDKNRVLIRRKSRYAWGRKALSLGSDHVIFQDPMLLENKIHDRGKRYSTLDIRGE